MRGNARQRRSTAAGSGRKHLFRTAAWTASVLMVFHMLPSESRAAKLVEKYEQAIPTVRLSLEELKSGPQEKKDVAEESGETETDSEAPEEVVSTETAPEIVETDADKAFADGSADTMQLIASDMEQAVTLSLHLQTEEKLSPVSQAVGSGTILLYHTHATEAYEPVSAAATHTTELAGTVREAGNHLSSALTAKGYQVIHDGTLHDSPSYNKSYNRSLETLTNLLEKYPSPKLVVDLHRDAASSAGGKAKTAAINGEAVASFALVVGTQNANYASLRALADSISQKANAMYPGFCTGIIEKPHKFNGYLNDSFLLLELGNNENTIDQANAAVPYLADVIANVIG